MERLASVQFFRAIAAMMVVLFHLQTNGTEDSNILMAGVDLFFVISGFIMIWLRENKPTSRGKFLLDRLVRVAPMYWLATLMLVIIIIFDGGLVSFTDLTKSFSFIPFTRTDGVMRPILGVGWTLSYEVLFYIFFAITLGLAPVRQVAVLSCTFLFLVGLRPFAGDNALAFRFTSPLFFEFIMGCGVALALPWISAMGQRLAFICIAAGLSLLVLVSLVEVYSPRFIVFGVPAVLILCGALAIEHLARKRIFVPLGIIGDASYSLYLTHPLLIRVLEGRVPSITIFVIAIGIAVVIHLAIEKPLTRSLKKAISYRQNRVSLV